MMPTLPPLGRVRHPARWAVAGLGLALTASACAPARGPAASAPPPAARAIVAAGPTTTSTTATSTTTSTSTTTPVPPRESAGVTSPAATRALLAALKGSHPQTEKRLPGGGPRAGGTAPGFSPNWSGYIDDNSSGRTYSHVSASWVQPAVTCAPDEDTLVAFWVGLDGYSSPTVEQDGTLAWCYGGQAYYYSWWEMYPDNSVVTVGTTVHAGDHITASVSSAGGAYSLQLTDSTTPGNSFRTDQTCAPYAPCSNTSAEWVAETPDGPRGLWPWPAFGSWDVTGARVVSGRTAGTVTTFPSDRITLVGADGQTLATTGALTASASAFSIAWRRGY